MIGYERWGSRLGPEDLYFLCAVLSPWTTGAKIDRLQESAAKGKVDWRLVALYANRANLAPALWHALQSKGVWAHVPPELQEYIEEIHRFNTGRNNSLCRQLLQVVSLLNGSGITPLLLKGSAAFAMDLFPDPADRFMWDLDLLIPEGMLKSAVGLLEENGYFVPEEYLGGSADSQTWLRAHHYAPLARHGAAAAVELHHRVLSGRCGDLLKTEAVWKESLGFESSRLPGVSLVLMSPTHQIIHSFLHSELAHRNHRLRRLDLRQLHHFAHLCLRLQNEIDWDRLAVLRKEEHPGRILEAYLHMAQELFGVETPLVSKPDAYARRHFSRVILFMNGRWKRLRLAREILDNALHSLSKERIEAVFPVEAGDCMNRLRRRRLADLLCRYRKLETWKVLVSATARQFDTLG